MQAVILSSDILNLCAAYRNTPLYCLQIFDKSALSLYAVREATKALLFSWDFFFSLLEGIRVFGRQHQLQLSRSTGMCQPLCM